MADSLALTFGSDLSGNSNIATISIESTKYTTGKISTIIGSYGAAIPTGASCVLIRPTYDGNYSAIIYAGVAIVDVTDRTSGPYGSVNVTGLQLSGSVSAFSDTYKICIYSNNVGVVNSSNFDYSSGKLYGSIFIFF